MRDAVTHCYGADNKHSTISRCNFGQHTEISVGLGAMLLDSA